MANNLVPYVQDTEIWKKHYIEEARKQTHPSDMLHKVQSCPIKPQIVAENVQLIAQAETQIKEDKTKTKVAYAPIKATPEFKSTPTPEVVGEKKQRKAGSYGRKRKISYTSKYGGKKRPRDIYDD